jgi:hypothetical protein
VKHADPELIRNPWWMGRTWDEFPKPLGRSCQCIAAFERCSRAVEFGHEPAVGFAG